jgi:thiosulfate/3-mercaptopyruvate sulfurtransferase
MSYRTVVSTELLATHLSTWVLVDCRFDLRDEGWGREQYRLGHIPGAVYASLSEDLSATPTGRNGRHPLPTDASLAHVFGRLGISAGAQVVVYDQDTGLFASRLWWSLRYLGHDDVAVLEGGWTKWTRERRPVAAGDEARPPATFHAQPRPQMRVDVEQLASRDPGMVLIDARGRIGSRGATKPWIRSGATSPAPVTSSTSPI